MPVTFEVLGNVEARRDGEPVDLGHLRQRAVLAALLADANTPVPAETLVDRVWGDDVPPRAKHALYSYLSRLRRAVGGEAELTRHAGGYVLAVGQDAVDLDLFRRLIGDARSAADEAVELALLERALGLWRGEAFAGLDTPWFSLTRHRLQTERFTAQLRRNDLALGFGRHAELLAELHDQAEQQPLDEQLAGQLMLALYRCGRQAEALDRFRRVREQLADELGTDPGSALAGLHQRILTADPVLTPATGALAESSWLPTPRQLPAPPPLFVGRADELARLTKALDTEKGTVVITAIGGTGGIGKTWLALRWAHENADRFPDGQLYANLRGFDPAGGPAAPAEVVRGFLGAFELPAERVPASLDAQVALFRSLLATRRMLVVLDNARDSEQVEPLLPGSPGCLVLVTSRDRMSGLVTRHNASPVSLATLTDEDATALLSRRLGEERVAREPGAVTELRERCARLPLALGIVAARATANPGFSLRALADELRDERERLDVLATDEPAADVRAVSSWSYQALGPRAARLFRLLGLHPGPDVGAHAAAALAGLDVAETRTLLAELARTHLLEEHVPGRYRAHDLLRAYAAERAAEEEPGPRRRAAVHRMLDHYLHTGYAAERRLAPHWEPITLAAPQPGAAPRDIDGYPAAMDWFTAEHGNVLAATDLAATDLAATTGFDTHAWQLPWTLSTFLNRQGFWHQRAETQRIALAAAERLGDRTAQAGTHHLLGRGHAILGEYEQAAEHLHTALAQYEDLGDRTGQATIRFSLTQLRGQQGRPAEAFEHSSAALELYRATGNRTWEAFSLSALGRCHALLGRFRESLASCSEALELLRDLGDEDGQAHTLHGLGYAHHGLGEHADAARDFAAAAPLFRALGDRYHEASALRGLGDAHRAAGEAAEARAAWTRALAILDRLAHPDAEAVRADLGGA